MNNETTTINSRSIQELMKKGEDILNEIFKSFFIEPKTIDEITDVYSKTIDELIIKSEKKENILFKGGKFIILATSNNDINVKAELFFQDSNDNWIKKEMSNRISKNHIEEISLKNMIDKNSEEFKIYHPKK